MHATPSLYNYWTNSYYLTFNNELVASGSNIWGAAETKWFSCITESPSMSPSRKPCTDDELDILVKLNTDVSGDQTTWQVMNNRNS